MAVNGPGERDIGNTLKLKLRSRTLESHFFGAATCEISPVFIFLKFLLKGGIREAKDVSRLLGHLLLDRSCRSGAVVIDARVLHRRKLRLVPGPKDEA